MADDSNSIPLSWVLLFISLTLAAGVAAVLLVGGSLFGQVLLPLV
ncbi:hypothetical protein [Haloarchaeobius sp. HRN-SO-5]